MFIDIINHDPSNDSHDVEACIVNINWIMKNFYCSIEQDYVPNSQRLLEAEANYEFVWNQLLQKIEEHRLTLTLVHAVTSKKHYFTNGASAQE